MPWASAACNEAMEFYKCILNSKAVNSMFAELNCRPAGRACNTINLGRVDCCEIRSPPREVELLVVTSPGVTFYVHVMCLEKCSLSWKEVTNFRCQPCDCLKRVPFSTTSIFNTFQLVAKTNHSRINSHRISLGAIYRNGCRDDSTESSRTFDGDVPAARCSARSFRTATAVA